jgi:hypothetical protein
MAYNKERKERFSNYLYLLSVEYSIKQAEMARNINTTRQHISCVFRGKIIFAPEHFKATCDLLHKKGASSDELSLLKRLFVEVKSNMDLKKINLNAPIDPTKQIIIENLDYLLPSELIKIHKKIEIYKFNHLREANEKLIED